MTPYLSTDRATLWHGRAEEIYPHLTPGSVSMVWSDGPYAMNKADWDRMGVDGLADWYAPHVEAWGRVCAPSATVYLWNTAEGWARIDPVMRAAGWTFRVLVTWLKTNPPSQKGQEALTCWADFTEVCGVYQRGPDWSAWIRSAVARSSSTRAEICRRIGIDSRLLQFWEEGERFPGEPLWLAATRVLGMASPPWEQLRPVFTAPNDFGNVWTGPLVGVPERLSIDGETHPCQKPLAFADRAIRASTRVGDTILDPFAGTNRIALACRRLPEEERRHAIGIEMDRRWLDAVRPSLISDHGHTNHAKQPSLFGGGS